MPTDQSHPIKVRRISIVNLMVTPFRGVGIFELVGVLAVRCGRMWRGFSLFAELLLAGAVGVHDPELVSPFVVGDSGAVG